NQSAMCEKRLGKRSRFLLELNEKPKEGGRVVTDFVRYFQMQHSLNQRAKLSVKFAAKIF
ncbi:MAG: hypothetical protein PUB33_00170, partial [Ligilactobacillus ruminis]|nr:hypothetical protein [Ligilactobacillus ruminis]